MQFTLKIDGKDKVFSRMFVPAGVFKEALRVNRYFRENELDVSSVESYDMLIDFVIFVFENQFTADEVWNGLQISDFQIELMKVYNEVLRLGGLVPDLGVSEEGPEEGGKK